MSEKVERPEEPTPEPKAWAYCPDCGGAVAGKRFCPACGRATGTDSASTPSGGGVTPASEPQPAPAPKTLPARQLPVPILEHPEVAFVAEFVPGLLGFLGVGWLCARRWPVGMGLLLGWWGLLVLTAASALVLFGEVCCFLWLPFHVLIPLISAFVVSGELRQARRRRLMGL